MPPASVSDDTDGGVDTVATNAKPAAADAGALATKTRWTGIDGDLDGLDSLLSFDAEEEAQEFRGNAASGEFIALAGPFLSVSDDEAEDWEADLSPVQIAGEGIGSGAATSPSHTREYDFLKISNHGIRSTKRSVVQTSTQMSIASDACEEWAEEILAKGCYSPDDVEALIALCEGNGDPKELRINLQRILEYADVNLVDMHSGDDAGLWDAGSSISRDELAEAINASLTRSIRLPGTQRFIMDKSDERRLLHSINRVEKELHMAILSSESAIEAILDALNGIHVGLRDPNSVSLLSVLYGESEHADTEKFFEAANILRSWVIDGRVMTGRRRRDALNALMALDLSPEFHKEIAEIVEMKHAGTEAAFRFNNLISTLDAATEKLVLKHLPYARRFAARNVREDEDPEDVFQAVFMGLTQSTRRFKMEKDVRFSTYCTFRMKSMLTRWRLDGDNIIRLPASQNEKFVEIDKEMDRLGIAAGNTVAINDLAMKLGWATEDIRRLFTIPRKAAYPENTDEWDGLFPEPVREDLVDQAETARIVESILAELQAREVDVIRMYFGIGRDAEMTLEEISQIYGVSRERIRQIKARGMERLSHSPRLRRLRELLGT